jgi:hypothetical protein
MTKRSPEREEFLAGILTTAIEHGGYGFPGVVEYKWEGREPADVYAVIVDRYVEDDDPEYGKHWRVDIGTIAHGFAVFRDNVKDLQTPADWVRALLVHDRTNGEDGDADVIGALAVLECALFGEIVYN